MQARRSGREVPRDLKIALRRLLDSDSDEDTQLPQEDTKLAAVWDCVIKHRLHAGGPSAAAPPGSGSSSPAPGAVSPGSSQGRASSSPGQPATAQEEEGVPHAATLPARL